MLTHLESAYLLIWGEGRPWHFYDKYAYLTKQQLVEIYHLEWGEGELTNQLLAWKFPLVCDLGKSWGEVWGRVWGNVQGKVWGKVQEMFREMFGEKFGERFREKFREMFVGKVLGIVGGTFEEKILSRSV